MIITNTNHRIETTVGVAGGKPRVTGRRITVQDIVIWHEWQGRSADEIAAEHSLALADIYAALAYYYEHQPQIDRSIAEQDSFVAALRGATPSKINLRMPQAAHGWSSASGSIPTSMSRVR